MLQLSDQYIVKEAVAQRNGIISSNELGYDTFWNGLTMISLSSEIYDTKQVLSLEKTFKSLDNSVTVNTVFNGDVYHHSSPAQYKVLIHYWQSSNTVQSIFIIIIISDHRKICRTGKCADDHEHNE